MDEKLLRPKWFKYLVKKSDTINFISNLTNDEKLFTVCESAKCPNRGECFNNKSLSFLILGNICTRNCKFCNIDKGKPNPVDIKEVNTIINVIKKLDLKYVVITSVTRDDLSDGGAHHFSNILNEIHKNYPNIKVEVLTPDFNGNINNLKIVLDSNPYIFNHNIEMVERLYPLIRSKSNYNISLNILSESKKLYPHIKTKSGIMLGLGEDWEEIITTIKDIKETGCDYLTIGHYIKPSRKSPPVKKYYTEEDFNELKLIALNLGFKFVISSPLARSSYLAHTYD